MRGSLFERNLHSRRRGYQPALEVLEDRCLLSTYYVAPRGNDANSGDIDHPFHTIQHALDLANPGDDIQVRTGTYGEKIAFGKSGNAQDGYITLEAFANEKPVLNGFRVRGPNMVLMNDVSYVKLIGFTITTNFGIDDGSGVRITGAGSHIEIRNNTIRNMHGKSAMGITVYGTSDTPISDLIIDGNEITHCMPAPSEALTLNGNVTSFQVTNNKVHDVNNIGIDLIGGETDINPTQVARNGLVRGNVVYRARSSYGGGYAAGIYVDGAKDIVIEDNVSYRNDLGLEVGAENQGIVASGIVVQNNLIYLNDKAGLVFGGFDVDRGRVQDCRFVNNTVVRNDTLNKGYGQLWIQYASNNTVTNNIFYASRNNVLLFSDAGNVNNVVDHNLWYAPDGAAAAQVTWNNQSFDGFAAYVAGTGEDAHSLFGDPLFVRLTKTAFDFHLSAGSPAINAGSATVGQFADHDFDGLLRDSQPDIGAYEFVAAAPAGSAVAMPTGQTQSKEPGYWAFR